MHDRGCVMRNPQMRWALLIPHYPLRMTERVMRNPEMHRVLLVTHSEVSQVSLCPN